jgi:tetratricopeptide (TPR) repeat protein
MAINLDKSAIEKQYYYAENGNTYGPFSLSILLTKINANTLIYFEGIEWTEAKEINDLKKYFKVEKIIEKQEPPKKTNSAKPIVEEKKSNNGAIWFVITLLIVGGVGYYFYNQNKSIATENITPVDSVKVASNTLTEFEIFDFNSIQNYKPTDEQKSKAQNLLEDGSLEMSNQNYTEAISKYKEALQNVPQAQTYFLLSNAYLKSNDFSRSEQCLQLAGSMDYQPKSELDYKLVSIHAIQGNYELVNSELLSLSNSNPKILSNVEKDTAFYSFRNSPNYLKIIEKNSIFDSITEESIYPNIIANYYEAMNNNTMDANDYYSEYVSQFINKKNTTPSEINQIINSDSEFIDSKVNLIGSKVIISGVNSRHAWVNFYCYRTSKKKFQSCRVKVEFIFDEQNKISSFKELEIKDLKFTK